MAQATKTWEDFPALPEGSAYHALVYNEKVNRLYSIAGERTRYDNVAGNTGPTWVSVIEKSNLAVDECILNPNLC